MQTFGQRLYTHRLQTNNPETGKHLSQEKLGELIGYTGRTIGNWEKDIRRPPHNDRPLMIKLLTVLNTRNGLSTENEANLLIAGVGYAPLTRAEVEQIALQPSESKSAEPERPPHQSPQPNKNSNQVPPHLLTNIWYTPTTYSLATLWRDYELGTLHIYNDLLQFEGENTQLDIRHLIHIEHKRQKGDLNANWVRITYRNDKAEKKIAWFAQGNRLGVGNLIGGSQRLYELLWHQYHRSFNT